MAKYHLLVLIHGMWGNPIHLAELERVARETYSEPTEEGINLHILTAQTIRDESTYDGVDWGGERVAQEVIDQVAAFEKDGDSVVRFSVTGYSLGGLIARYCIGVLQQRGFFDKIEPINFDTIATPHCGLPSYPTLFSSLSRGLGPKLLSRTGEQFFCVDKWSPKGRPLLVVMADPERVFYQTLAKFKHLRIYANAVNDMTVPYVTSAIETSDPFADEDTNGIEIATREKYACLIERYTLPDVPPPKAPKPTVLSPQWFKGTKPSKPFFPPFLQFRFPLNLVFYASLPILIPTFITLALIRLSLASRSSRARIKLLEKESQESQTERLVHVLADLEREMEEAVVDLIDNPDPSPSYQPAKKSRAHPIISATHVKIANWLNTLPIQKELAYFPLVRNSHAMIVCRDMKRFEAHKQGLPVVHHWAGSLVI
ncbi:putative serine esterase-domain-containing protein [Panaeolus papilionaceus]|nr:putative serine esterase-domain-containing protein [Panaeolus papilionaceus]